MVVSGGGGERRVVVSCGGGGGGRMAMVDGEWQAWRASDWVRMCHGMVTMKTGPMSECSDFRRQSILSLPVMEMPNKGNM